MMQPKTTAEAVALLDCLAGDLEQLSAGDWIPDADSCAASIEVLDTARAFFGKPETGPDLLSSERRALAHYIMQAREERAAILADAIANPETSGPLIQCYRSAATKTHAPLPARKTPKAYRRSSRLCPGQAVALP